MNRRTRLGLTILTISTLAAVLPPDALAHHSGTWKWTYTTESGQSVEAMVKLHREGRSFAGVYTGQKGEPIPIASPKLDGRQIAFEVTGQRHGQEFTARFQGKIAGDTITGKQQLLVDGQKRTLPWEAKRVREINVTGTWKWSRTTRSGQEYEYALRLEQRGTAVSGLYIGRDGDETPITDGKLQEDQLSFLVTRERNGRQFTVHYHGKVARDSVEGEFEFNIDDQARSRPWEAKRVRPPAKAAGTWNWSTTRDGQTVSSTLRLKQDGSKITGVYSERDKEKIEIAKATLHGNQLSFEVTQEHNGQKVTSKYRGRIMGDMIHGASESGDGDQAWRADRAKTAE